MAPSQEGFESPSDLILLPSALCLLPSSIELDLIADVMAENPQGKSYNLDELFDKVNYEYFSASLAKPRLAWSRINTYRKLGHYESARDRVVISLTLDDTKIPEFVVEFILYHELLHKYHGTHWVQGRRMVHTKEFRASERQFKFYNEALEWLKKSSKPPIPFTAYPGKESGERNGR